MSAAMYDEAIGGVVYLMRSETEVALVTPNTVVTDTLKHIQREKFLERFIYSTSFPYVLYNDSKGPSVISVDKPNNINITFNSSLETVGIYTGKILYRESEIAYILQSEMDAIEQQRNDTVAVTKALSKQDFEKVAFGIESEIIERPEFHTKKCRLVDAPYFMTFVLKVSVLDVLLLLILIIIIIYHRSHIVPARRRYKIRMGILRHRKKRKLRDRARRRLRRLNLLRRKQRAGQQELDAKRQAVLVAAAVGQLGLAQRGAGAAAKKKSSSTSSSDLITVGGEGNLPTGLNKAVPINIFYERQKKRQTFLSRGTFRAINIHINSYGLIMAATTDVAAIDNQKTLLSTRDISDEQAKALAILSLTHTYSISGGILFSCCILPLLYFWFCHPMIYKYFTSVKVSTGNKFVLEETQVDGGELAEFVPDEAPDRVNIRRDPFFDDVKVKAFHRRHHHLLRPPHRRQQQQQSGKKLSSMNKTSENENERDESAGNAPEEKHCSHTAESSAHRSGKEQLTSTEITFSHQTQLHAL
ncbi:unnamed protein product [Litomosoides sigmodontis]|uniref:Uncharacterized protein n=1 Tax=Litomosoides sigmodontis TaxID=42156 RepID=A0A3P6TYS9_LITSI|nr:unnamed protein product [Litomosoides sigmodontis]